MLKKFSAALITIAAMAAATLTAAPAQAGPAAAVLPLGNQAGAAVAMAAPYPDTVNTRTTVRFRKNPIKSGQRARAIIRVRGTGSAGSPRFGSVVLRAAGTRYQAQVRRGFAYVRLERLRGFPRKVRIYTVRAKFYGEPRSVFRNSSGSRILVVRRQRR